MQGFTFPYKHKSVFVETTQRNKTKNLARKILNKMQLPDVRADELLYWMRKGELTYTHINGWDWYSIDGTEVHGKYHESGPVKELIHIKL